MLPSLHVLDAIAEDLLRGPYLFFEPLTELHQGYNKASYGYIVYTAIH